MVKDGFNFHASTEEIGLGGQEPQSVIGRVIGTDQKKWSSRRHYKRRNVFSLRRQQQQQISSRM